MKVNINTYFPDAANVANPLAIDGNGNNIVNQLDLGHARARNCKAALFTGMTAPTRLASFIANYVNESKYTGPANNKDYSDPSNYTNEDIGLPIGSILSIYFNDGIWTLIFLDNNAYNKLDDVTDANNNPFNMLPIPGESGYSL